MESITLDIPSNDGQDDNDDDSFYVANCNLTARRAETDFYKVVEQLHAAAPDPDGQPKVAEKYVKEEEITKKPSIKALTSWEDQPNFNNVKSLLPSLRDFRTYGGLRRKQPSLYHSITMGPAIKPKLQLNRIKIKSRRNVIFKGTIKGHWDGKRNRGIGDDEDLLKEPEVAVLQKRVRIKILSKSLFQRSRPNGFYTRGLLISLGLCLCFSIPITILVILLLGVRASYDGW